MPKILLKKVALWLKRFDTPLATENAAGSDKAGKPRANFEELC